MNYKNSAISLITATIISTGCATTGTVETKADSKPVAPDPAVVALSVAANRIQQSAIELKQVQSMEKLSRLTPEQVKAKAVNDTQIPPGLGNTISIEGYDGPFLQLIEAVAKASNWNYLVEGIKPPVIQVVHKKYNHVKTIDVLRDIGYSITGATIVLDPINKNIIVRFG